MTVENIFIAKHALEINSHYTAKEVKGIRSVEKIRQIRLKPGQEIIISEGFISGYALKVVGKNISIRVRRIK